MSNIFKSYHKNKILRWKIRGKCERKKIERKNKKKIKKIFLFIILNLF